MSHPFPQVVTILSTPYPPTTRPPISARTIRTHPYGSSELRAYQAPAMVSFSAVLVPKLFITPTSFTLAILLYSGYPPLLASLWRGKIDKHLYHELYHLSKDIDVLYTSVACRQHLSVMGPPIQIRSSVYISHYACLHLILRLSTSQGLKTLFFQFRREFHLASPYSSIVYYLPGPNSHALTQILPKTSGSVDGAPLRVPTSVHFHYALGLDTQTLA